MGTISNKEAHTPATCHKALEVKNPSYTALTVTQHPSWVKAPSLYKDSSVFSLSFAFKDPDGSLAQKLLAKKELYIFGNNATIKKWKQKPLTKKSTPPPTTANPQATDSLKSLEPQMQAPGKT